MERGDDRNGGSRLSRRIGAVLLCGSLIGTLGFAGCGDDDEADSPAGPPPLATKSIGAYKFDNPQVARDADAARRATGRYLNEKNALADGYEPQPSRNRPVCNDPPGKGDGGIEYVNSGLLKGKLDISKPAVLYYQPAENGTRRLIALQYRPSEGQIGGRLFGQQVDGPLTVWVWLYNPDGLFARGNVNSECPPGPARELRAPADGGGPPGGAPPGADGGGPPPGQ